MQMQTVGCSHTACYSNAHPLAHITTAMERDATRRFGDAMRYDVTDDVTQWRCEAMRYHAISRDGDASRKGRDAVLLAMSRDILQAMGSP